MYQACEKLQKFPAYLNHHSKCDHFTINNSTRKQTYRESVHSARECFDWQWQFCQNHPEKLVLALAVNPSQSSTSACHVTNAVSIFFITIKWYNKSHFLLLIKTAVQCWLWTTPQISLYLKRQFTKPKTHYGLFFRMTWVSQQQNGKTIPDVNESKDDVLLGQQWQQPHLTAQFLQAIIAYRPDALPDTQSTVSKHWGKKRQFTNWNTINRKWQYLYFGRGSTTIALGSSRLVSISVRRHVAPSSAWLPTALRRLSTSMRSWPASVQYRLWWTQS